MPRDALDSDFLQYLLDNGVAPGDGLPTLKALSEELGVSVGKLREQLEVARSLGIVSVRPRVGIHREPFDFTPFVMKGMLFGLRTEEATFAQFAQLRRALETELWDAAVSRLTDDDRAALRAIVAAAWEKLRGEPRIIPNGEHRDLHLTIFSRLDNSFVQGILQSYWAAYDLVEVTRFADYSYFVAVWEYHERIVDALCAGDVARGRQLLIEHFSLLRTGAQPDKLRRVADGDS